MPEPDDQGLEATAGAGDVAEKPPQPPPKRSSRARKTKASDGKRKPARRRTPKRERPHDLVDHPQAALLEQLVQAAQTYLAGYYGSDGDKLAAAVANAMEIEAAGHVEENPLPLIDQVASAAQAALLERRGMRDLGTGTRLVMEIRNAATAYGRAHIA